jgi:two-component sensor histidine kinase
MRIEKLPLDGLFLITPNRHEDDRGFFMEVYRDDMLREAGVLDKPFVQENTERSGLGLGLTIAQRAVHLCQGTIQVRNSPGAGCTFVIDIPQKVIPSPSNKTAVAGKDSVQPDFVKKT